MSIKLLDFEDVCVVKPPHSCDTSCGDLCATYAEIVMTGRKIGELNDAMAEQLSRYRGLKTKMNLLRDPIAKWLPVELAIAIFGPCLPKQCSQLQRNDTTHRGEDNASVLFTLGAVCKTWREIIWSTPRLWSYIRIPLSPSDIQLTTSFVKDWLSRTGQVSLSVAVYYARLPGMSSHDFEWTEEAVPLSKIVNATSCRWEYLDTKLPPILVQMFGGNPSNLCELRILDAGRQEEQLRPGSLTLKEGPKPMPTYVELEFACLKAIDIARDHVTDIKFDTMPVKDCLELLRLTPKLTQCEFSSMRLDSDIAYVAGIHHIVHNNLRDFTFNYPDLDLDGDRIACYFFDQLILPRLESLTVKLDGESLPSENLISLIDRSSCQLRRLSVGSLLDADDLDDLLNVVPFIWYLKLSSYVHAEFSPRNLVETLVLSTRIWDTEEENFLPKLQVLEFVTEDPDKCLMLSNLIPDILGDPDISDSDSDESEEDETLPTRPLNTLVISLLPTYMEGHRLRYINEAALLRIQALRDLQYKIDINILTSTGRIDKDYVEMSLANVEKDGEIAAPTSDAQ